MLEQRTEPIIPAIVGRERNPLSIDLWTKEVFLQKEYIHYNPVAAGLCAYPEDYEYSSAKFYESGVDEFGFIKHWMA